MNQLKSKGFNIAALAMIIIDNPLLILTGNRICNDCTASCIYQKQDPVDIPLIESNILDNILELPYGVEIYLLLTRWNPLNISSFLPKSNTGYNIAVVGLGPAGIAASHYLLNHGHYVTAIESAKIENISEDFYQVIKNWDEFINHPKYKMPQGVGGVAEYGITNRWNKKNLILARLMLERRENFIMHGSTRVGSNITIEELFNIGFDHISLCIGAGKPIFDNFASYFLNDIRTATEFLMILHQQTPYLYNSGYHLTIRLPIIIIGCGLTAIDAAVESINYYPVQVEKFLKNYEQKLNTITKEKLEANWSEQEKELANEFITHAKLFRNAKNTKQKLAIINQLGGITIYYRNNIKNSAAYRQNFCEIEYAMSMGVNFQENTNVTNIIPNKLNFNSQVIINDQYTIDASTILVAIGTKKNEYIDLTNNFNSASNSKFNNSKLFKDTTQKISFLGDANPDYSGSVVEAIASAKNSVPIINNILAIQKPKHATKCGNSIQEKIQDYIFSHIHAVKILSKNYIEITINSKSLAHKFKAGNFFRLQIYKANSHVKSLSIAVTAFDIDHKNNYISLIIFKENGVNNIYELLKSDNKVKISLTGPLGSTIEKIKNKIVVVVATNRWNIMMLSICRQLKDDGCKILFFSGYERAENQFYHDKFQSATDIIVWSAKDKPVANSRDTDYSFQSNLIESIYYYNNQSSKNMHQPNILALADYVICAISVEDLAQITQIRHLFTKRPKIMCMTNNNPYCMMKGICGKCIIKVNSPTQYIFSCEHQYQNLDDIDTNNIKNKHIANTKYPKL
ncbi:FAD-dependent oxidoreductase [Rickettsia endosymbiont of Cardiosporidium cionae]|uniref:FAD-dependent oxidoreductase n=1 Tax=Rickettsia endosymbiont of Cardiosporidium cionae TaxID=2777155 RepID=UPI0018934142|nr:FAD-dependent oxidoreductase [Rickettsia endosymbiont of Cardiosporidium cionae]KAF8818662.1 palindromic element RPE2 domain-containing protein [Rickettsia endosymbiont of Cardiosporidium cionae]